ncbi:GAF and ANTAR domain-containing protein [Nocardioides marmoribigeumensis]|uniref:GAF domain-containing protein n=1 Tax=Nocardioides marmoribigeumensis TaxID=433649 RepID=A0ABU2C1H0_9ACTN|nr:GAF and ANTAR domain-containing protein [Nocardioides marmoribigeumensis]MDR7364514.1 GAF domain-containing protein [Nocardioides marmoribigeumensis]
MRDEDETEAEERDPRWAQVARLVVGVISDSDHGDDLGTVLTRLIRELVDVLPAGEAGLLLLDDDQHPGLAAATDTAAHRLEVQQLTTGEGPCIEAIHTGRLVLVTDLERPARFPDLAGAAVADGFRSILAVPMRANADLLGCVNFFFRSPQVSDDAARRAQDVVDVVALSIATREQLHDATQLADQLARALQSRIVIEQAKGVLAERLDVSLDEAFGVMRRFARTRRMALPVLARKVVSRQIAIAEVLEDLV